MCRRREKVLDTEGVMPEIAEAPHRVGYGFLAYFFLCFAVSGIPCAAAILLWSDIGWGKDVYSFFSEGSVKGYALGAGAFCIVLALYLEDFFWPPHLEGQYFVLYNQDRCVGRSILVVAGVLIYAAALNLAEVYPSVPIQCTVLLGPLLTTATRAVTRPVFKDPMAAALAEQVGKSPSNRLMKMQRYVGSEKDATAFYAGSMTAFLLLGVITVIAWVVWALSNNIDFGDVDFVNAEEELQYVRWISPVAVGLAYVMFGLIVSLRVGLAGSYDQGDMLLKMVKEEDQECSASGRRSIRRKTLVGLVSEQLKEEDNTCRTAFDKLSNAQKDKFAEKQMRNLELVSRMIKTCGCVFALMIGTTWMASQLVTSDSHLSDLVLGFLGVFTMSFCLFVVVAFQRLNTKLPLYRLAVSLLQSDWIRALLVFCFSPAVPFVLVLSFVNQRVRGCRRLAQAPTTLAPIDEEQESIEMEESTYFTRRIARQVEIMEHDWNWISILMKVFVFGLLMMLYTTFPIMLNIFLAWMSAAMADWNFAVVCVGIVVAGLCCFLLPPVPGVPVYVFTGIIIADRCPWGFEAGAAVAIGVGFVLKLMACAMQQKLIGERLGNITFIRAQVGINQPMIRALEAVLRKPGLSLGKVSILCGGPDWPTSVLAGILRLSLLECEIGTLPIVFFVAACSLSGSFYLKKTESEFWDRIATFMMSASVGLCVLLQIMGVWAIQTELDQNEWELSKPLEQNLNLDWLDFRSREVAKSKTIRWRDVPCWLKTLLLLAVVVAGQLFYWASSICFGSFELTDSIDSLQLWVDGSSGLVLLPGLAGCSICLGGWVIYFIMARWLSAQQSKSFKERGVQLDTIEAEWKDRRQAAARQLANSTASQENWEELDTLRSDVEKMLLKTSPQRETE
ncbi:unnamed protein product [Effrenium voratum]|uniref:Uncharacterized protein n=1 Tax=Effrenium voratum TaxID=2562239 RepID=A0AA36HWM3_9DINO|nr:unnamed protein product [Effrenium voratum]